VFYAFHFRRQNMKLPHTESAIVPRGKVEDYLLTSNIRWRREAKFFNHFGFQRRTLGGIAAALLRHAEENPITEALTDADGITYVIQGGLMTPLGRQPRVRAIWLVETGGLAPRFITAYPLAE